MTVLHNNTFGRPGAANARETAKNRPATPPDEGVSAQAGPYCPKIST
jgi:hypothetical protein